MTDDELVTRVRKVVSEMCEGDRWRMCIPPQPDDSDIAITELADRFDRLRAAPAGAPPAELAGLRRVPQEDRLGCGIACLAMVSGKTYAEVRSDFRDTLIDVGLADGSVVWWLNKEQFWNRRSWMDGEGGRPAPSSGTALMLTDDAHWVVLHNGDVLDPARPEPLPSYRWRQAIEVLPPNHSRAALASPAERTTERSDA